MMLFRRELWHVLKSVLFLLMSAGLVLFAASQGVFPPEETLAPPAPGGSYGMKDSGDPALIMPEAATALLRGHSSNRYTTYPNGFAKTVRLNEKDRAKMEEVIAALSAKPVDFQFNQSITWEQFCTHGRGGRIAGGRL